MEGTERKIRNLKFYIVISTAVFILITALFTVTTVFYMFAVGKYMTRDRSGSAATEAPATASAAKHDIILGNIVSGDAGEKDKYFRFGVEVTGVNPGDSFDIEYSGEGFRADRVVKSTGSTREEYRGKVQPSSVTAGEDGRGTADIYLSDGQTVVIRDVPSTAEYTVTEDSEDYVPSVTASEGETGSKKNTVTVKSATQDNTIVFENTFRDTGPVENEPERILFVTICCAVAMMMIFKLITDLSDL